jgi:signal peptide peptidase SppA
MLDLIPYQNSLWLADGERFQRFIHAALRRPCPSAETIREYHRHELQMAKDLPGQAIQSDAASMIIGKTEAPRAIRAVKGKIGVIPVYGPVDQRMSGELAKAGGTSLTFVNAAFDALLSDPAIGAIVLRFDSPGGGVAGVQELADKIYAARPKKPCYAIADSLAASAAYWLASAASMVIATPGGDVGSVGVYVMHVDQSGAMEKEGYKVTTIQAAKYKTEFSPYAPLSEDARAEAQARVDEIYAKFTSALARNFDVPIGDVRKNFGEGRVVGADKALAAGMAHRVMSFDELIAKLSGGASPSSGTMPASADARRLRWEQKRRELEAI